MDAYLETATTLGMTLEDFSFSSAIAGILMGAIVAYAILKAIE